MNIYEIVVAKGEACLQNPARDEAPGINTYANWNEILYICRALGGQVIGNMLIGPEILRVWTGEDSESSVFHELNENGDKVRISVTLGSEKICTLQINLIAQVMDP